MIVGCYTLDLYCVHESLPLDYGDDGEPVPVGHHRCAEFPHQFTGPTGGSCKAAARKRGWKFVDGDAVCPRCARSPRQGPAA